MKLELHSWDSPLLPSNRAAKVVEATFPEIHKCNDRHTRDRDDLAHGPRGKVSSTGFVVDKCLLNPVATQV